MAEIMNNPLYYGDNLDVLSPQSCLAQWRHRPLIVMAGGRRFQSR